MKGPDGLPLQVSREELVELSRTHGPVIELLHLECTRCAPPTREELLSSPAQREELIRLLGFDKYSSMRDTFVEVVGAMFGAKK